MDKSIVKQEITDQINKIVLLKIKTLIVKNLKNEDIPEFERIVKTNNLNEILAFAQKKVPALSTKIYKEMESLGKKFAQPIYA